MTMGQMRDIPMGSPVYTADNDKIGTVKEVQGTSFKVDASGQPDYWLPASAVMSATLDRVMVSFRKDSLGDYKMNKPAAVV